MASGSVPAVGRVDGDFLLAAPPVEWQNEVWDKVRKLRETTPDWMWPDVDICALPQPPAIISEPLPPPAKYLRLYQWLAAQTADELLVTHAQFDELIDGGLPWGATHGGCIGDWWSNKPSKTQVRSWVNAGYLVASASRLDHSPRVVFVRGPKRVPTRAEVVRHRLIRVSQATRCLEPRHRNSGYPPADVYIAHLPDQGIYKVGIGLDAAHRMKRQRNGRQMTTVQTVRVSHKCCAFGVEAVVLNLTEPWRTIDDRYRSGGALECWSDEGQVPDLREIAERFNSET